MNQAARKLSDDDGCRIARRNRVLTWVGVTVFAAISIIAEQVRLGQSAAFLALMILAFLVPLWISLTTGRDIVDAVWLDGDALRVEARGHTYRVSRNQVVAIDEPFRHDWTPFSRPRPIRVRLHGRSALGSDLLFVPNRRADVEALNTWFADTHGR